MALPEFKCLQCGKCCSSYQGNKSSSKRTGISLFPKERKLFPEDSIKPQVGIGRKPTDKKFRIIAYQMIEDTCPFLKHNKCVIYEKRPIACRSFPLYPFILIGKGITMKLDTYCTALEKLGMTKPDERVAFTKTSLVNELFYVKKLSKLSFQILKRIRRAWIFDSSSDKWIRFRDTVARSRSFKR